MAEATAPQPASPTREAEESGFYHETALNASWVGARLVLGSLSFGLGSFVFAYFFLRSVNSHDMWHPAGFKDPQPWAGAVIMGLIVASALVQVGGLTRVKAGNKAAWQAAATAALALGLGAMGVQVWQLLNLPFFPGSAGYASVFVSATPVFLAVVFCAMIWLEILIARARRIPAISFIEQPPTYTEAFAVQRFQASLSAFTVVWNFLAVVAILFWVLFYLTV